MTDPLCGVCQTNEMHGKRATWTTCEPCEDWTRDRLNEVEHLWLELPDHLERGRSHSGPRVSGNTPEAGAIPLAEAVLDLIGPGGVPDRISPHDTEIRAARGLTGRPYQGSGDYRVSQIVKSLRRHLPWAAQHHDLRPLALKLQALLEDLRQATGKRDDPPTTTALPGQLCPALGEQEQCGGAMRYDRSTAVVYCSVCHAEYSPADWLDVAVSA